MVKKQKRKKLKEKAIEKEDSKKGRDWAIKISQTQSDVKSFLEKFKADVAEKIEKYRKYAQESQKKKKP